MLYSEVKFIFFKVTVQIHRQKYTPNYYCDVYFVLYEQNVSSG